MCIIGKRRKRKETDFVVLGVVYLPFYGYLSGQQTVLRFSAAGLLHHPVRGTQIRRYAAIRDNGEEFYALSMMKRSWKRRWYWWWTGFLASF